MFSEIRKLPIIIANKWENSTVNLSGWPITLFLVIVDISQWIKTSVSQFTVAYNTTIMRLQNTELRTQFRSMSREVSSFHLLSWSCLQNPALFQLHTIVKSSFRSTATEQPKLIWSCPNYIFLRILHAFNLTTTELISHSLSRGNIKLGKHKLLTSRQKNN